MQTQAKVGLLPLYLSLYDEVMPECRGAFGPFLDTVSRGLAAHHIEVTTADVCRVRSEVDAAVASFETQGVDCIATLHLAYSPSGESVPALTATPLPLLLLDTTMDADFGRDVDPGRIMYNHGVHGVMDLASVLRRHGRHFEIAAGHVSESGVLAHAADLARAALAARLFRSARALRLGPAFEGMGDFAVPADVMRDALGITVSSCGLDELQAAMDGVGPAEIEAEMVCDRERFEITADDGIHRRSAHTGLGLRHLLEGGGYTAFSANFQAFDRPDGPVMPFLEVAKAMSRGIGFGGEGDVLTASLVGALAASFGDTTFTEIFCSDWAGGSLFLSHMGEINPDLAAKRPVIVEKDMPFLGCGSCAAVACGIRRGPAVFANLTPGPCGSFDLIVAPVEMLGDTDREDMAAMVRGWMRPRMPVAAFLQAYSRAGGTHHSALVMGQKAEAMIAFAKFAGLGTSLLTQQSPA